MIASGGRNRSTLPNVPAVSVNTPLAWQYCDRGDRLAVRIAGALHDQLGGDHRTAAPDVADDVRGRGDVAQLAKKSPHRWLCPGEQLMGLDFVEHPQGGGAGDRVAAAACRRFHRGGRRP